MKETEIKLCKLLADILKINSEDINDEMSPDSVETWDSFNGLMLAAELEKVFKVNFDMEEIISTKNVGDIKGGICRCSALCSKNGSLVQSQ